VIEVDGESHGHTVDADAARTRFLEAQGYRVVRFTNSDVLGNLDGVAKAVELALANRPSPNPSRKREGSMWGPTVRWHRRR
jgi:very-short-patch-repair endonuclease